MAGDPKSPIAFFSDASWLVLLSWGIVFIALVKLLRIGRRPKDYPPGLAPDKLFHERSKVLISEQVLQHYQ